MTVVRQATIRHQCVLVMFDTKQNGNGSIRSKENKNGEKHIYVTKGNGVLFYDEGR